jgi:hypothetical protein
VTNLDDAIEVLREALEACLGSDPHRIDLIAKLSIVLATRFNKTGQLPDLLETMTRYGDVPQAADIDDPTEANQLISLGMYIFLYLYAHLDKSNQSENLYTSISLLREGLALLPVHHPNHFPSLDNLATALRTRFDQSGQYEDLDLAISARRDALKQLSAPRHSLLSTCLNELAFDLGTRFKQSGSCEDLDEAISLHRDALKLRPAPHPNRCNSLNNLATVLDMRFDQSGQGKDLNEAIVLYRDTLKLRPAPHPLRSAPLNNLANALGRRFNQSGQPEDLDEAISLHRDVLALRPAPHPDRSESLHNLAVALNRRFDQSGQRGDLDEAILFSRDAFELRAPSHPDRHMSLSNLAKLLMTRFDQSGQHEDLDETISLLRKALKLRPAPHPLQYMFLNNLASALGTRFDQSRQRMDLDEAIALHRDALALRPAPHPDRSISMNNLACALLGRFNQSGQQKDLDEAISLNRGALKLRAAPHPLRASSLDNLGIALKTRFGESGRLKDLDESISCLRDALELRPALHPHRSESLHNLAVALNTRFDQSGQREDLDMAILFNRDALELRAAPHPRRYMSLNNLGTSLRTRFDQSGLPEDLDEAIKSYQGALNTLVSGHHLTCSVAVGMAHALMVAHTRINELEHLDKAMTAFRVAVTCETSSVYSRFHAAKSWAKFASYFNHESALDAYHAAIELLPRLAMLGLDLQARQQALTSGSDGLARDAAACAIRSGQFDKAVELLEEGRAVFWSQALQLRTPMADLRDIAPELEDNLRQISFALEQGSLRGVSTKLFDNPQKKVSMEEEASQFHCLNDEWLATIEKVRRLDGFQDFLRPRRLSALQCAAANGPVVLLNASKTGCAALILTSTGVQHVLLPNLTFADVDVLVKLVKIATQQDSRSAALPEPNRARVEGLVQQIQPHSDTLKMLRLPFERHVGRVSDAFKQPDDVFRYALGVLWVSAVEPIFRSLNLQVSSFKS